MQEMQIVWSASNNKHDHFRWSIGRELPIDQLLSFLSYLIVLDASMVSSLNSELKLPIQVAIERRFPEQITFLLARHYSHGLVRL